MVGVCLGNPTTSRLGYSWKVVGPGVEEGSNMRLWSTREGLDMWPHEEVTGGQDLVT